MAACGDLVRRWRRLTMVAAGDGAIKKRSRESVSSHLPSYTKLNCTTNEVELSRINGVKKFKGVSDGSGTTGSITKDEEEVAETLNALAAMFPDSAEIDKTKTNGGQTLETKPSAFLIVENSKHGVEDTAALEEESRTKTIITDNAEVANVDSGALSMLSQPDLSLTSDKVEKMAADIRCQHEVVYTHKEKKNNGSQLWPGLLSTETRNSEQQRPSSTSKLLSTVLDTSRPLHLPPSGRSGITEKAAHVPVDSKKSRKRWPTNVYISRLIKNLQMTNRETLQMKCTQSNQGARTNPTNLNEKSNGLNGIPSTETAVSSDEIRNAMLLHKRLLQDQQRASASSRFHALQKQNIDFLPLSAGGVRTDINNVTAKVDHGPHLQSQHRSVIPFLWPGVSTSSTHQPFLQLQQHQNNTGRAAPPGTPNWQNGRQNTPSLIHYAQSIFPPSRYAQASRQPQNYVTVPPTQPPTWEQGQNHSLPYKSYEENVGGHRTPETIPLMQLLCNEHF